MVPQHPGFPVYQDSTVFPRDGTQEDVSLCFLPMLSVDISFVSEGTVKSGKMPSLLALLL